MKQELLEKLVKELSVKIKHKKYKCPICEYEQVMQACTGIFLNILHENNLDPLRFGPKGIPTLPIICNNCGYITQHAVTAFISDWEQFKKEYEEQTECN